MLHSSGTFTAQMVQTYVTPVQCLIDLHPTVIVLVYLCQPGMPGMKGLQLGLSRSMHLCSHCPGASRLSSTRHAHDSSCGEWG